MEFLMKKTVLFLGLATLVYATPAYAAYRSTTHKPIMHTMAGPGAKCMVHGKKVHGRNVYWVHGKKYNCMPAKHVAKLNTKHHAASVKVTY
jgi:hypothetical protein